MKVKVELDMQDFYDSFDGESIVDMMTEELRKQIHSVVKKDPKYKAYINKKASELLSGIAL